MVLSTAVLPTQPQAVEMRHMSSNVILGSSSKDHKSGDGASQHLRSTTDIYLGSRSPNSIPSPAASAYISPIINFSHPFSLTRNRRHSSSSAPLIPSSPPVTHSHPPNLHRIPCSLFERNQTAGEFSSFCPRQQCYSFGRRGRRDRVALVVSPIGGFGSRSRSGVGTGESSTDSTIRSRNLAARPKCQFKLFHLSHSSHSICRI